MLLPARGRILAEVVSRERILPSGLILPDKQRLEKKDNICRCLGVGDPAISNKGKPIPMVARRTDIIHFKQGFGVKLTYEDKKLIVLRPEEIIAVEREGELIAPPKMVICKFIQEEQIGTIIVPDSVKSNSGDYYGEVMASGREDLKRGDKIVFLRNEGYRFRTLEREDLISIKDCWIYAKEDV